MKRMSDYILGFLLAMIIIIMFIQVLFRYSFNNSLSWSEEIAKFIFIWITFYGAALCYRDRLHIGVEFLTEKLSLKWKKYMSIVENFLITGFNGFLAVAGFLWVIDVSGTLTPAVGLPLHLVFYAALPTAATVTFAFGVVRLTKEIGETLK